ncbi:MAG TPA: glycosyltransferase [Thermoplasmatales archaeon]|nr:glycosyltransferase [Thermoplasmatales archaeon]HEX17341.1 glycosyltransferase [Thermoplasmatales archaeon]
MKILYITPLRGGIGHWSRCLIEELDKKADVTIVTFRKKRKEDDDRPFTRIDDPFILEAIDPDRPYHLIEYNNPETLKETIDLTLKIKPDVVHFIMWAGPQILWFLKGYTKRLRELSIPNIATLHEVYPHIAGEEEKRKFLDSYTHIDHLVVLTEDAKRELEESGIRIPSTVIPHGNYHAMDKRLVDKRRAREILGERLGVEIGEDVNVVGFFGFIRKYKGLIYLIRSAPKVLKRFPDTIFFAAGSIELDEDPHIYDREIGRLGLEDRFFLYKSYVEGQEFFESVFKASDVMVFPYIGISQSGAMITSISMKCPVIISEIGSFVRELKEKGVIRTSKPGDPDSIASEISWVLEDKERARRLAEHAYEVFSRDYSWERIARRYMEVYEKVIRGT